MYQTNRFIAVIPAYNEAEHIAQVVRAAKRYVPVLVVDDGSMDDTVKLALEAGADVIRHTINQGKGAALRTGFVQALDKGAEAVITLDGDGQHAPDEIPKFLEAYNVHHADLIVGKRDFRKMPLVRRIANNIGGWLFTWAMGQPIPDNQSGYRLLSRPFTETVLNSQEHGFEFEVEMLEICLKRHFDLIWIPIHTIYAGESSHIRPLAHLVNFLRIVFVTRRHMRDTL